MNAKLLARQVSILLLGIIVPSAVLVQAYIGIASLSSEVGYTGTTESLTTTLINAKKYMSDSNDYSLFSLMYTESANQKTMINKQIMKISIMQIGFAVISVGMMFIVLGINDGGAKAGGSINDIKFDFQTGSTGVVVFIVGALMSTAGGVLKNDYSTVPIPNYHKNVPIEYVKTIGKYKSCKKVFEMDKEKFSSCFIGGFEDINKGTIK